MTQREFAKFIGLSARQVGRLSQAGIIPQQPDGSYDQEQAVQGLLRNYRRRLTIAESLCRRFMPEELDDRYCHEGLRSDTPQ